MGDNVDNNIKVLVNTEYVKSSKERIDFYWRLRFKVGVKFKVSYRVKSIDFVEIRKFLNVYVKERLRLKLRIERIVYIEFDLFKFIFGFYCIGIFV